MKELAMERATDPFKLARRIDEGLNFGFSEDGWYWRFLGEEVRNDYVRARIAGLLKEVFDADPIIDDEGRVREVTTELVDNVMLALSALEVGR
jgi:hypothetical protein